jgi:hypothetical protein
MVCVLCRYFLLLIFLLLAPFAMLYVLFISLFLVLTLLRSWVHSIPPGPLFPVVQLRHCFEFILDNCRTDSLASMKGRNCIWVTCSCITSAIKLLLSVSLLSPIETRITPNDGRVPNLMQKRFFGTHVDFINTI